MSERDDRNGDEPPGRGGGEDAELRQRLERIRELSQKSDKEILASPRGKLVTALKRFLHMLLRPALAPFIDHQRRVDAESLELLHSLAGRETQIARSAARAAQTDLEAVRGELTNRVVQCQTDLVARTDLLIGFIEKQIEAFERDLGRHDAGSSKQLETLVLRLEGLERRVATLSNFTSQMAREIAAAGNGPLPEPPSGDEYAEPLSSAEGAAHLETFRSGIEEIERRQSIYLDYFRGCPGPVLDAGCGRGEFLGILKQENIKAYGVDSNAHLVEVCIERGLNVQRENLLDHLQHAEPGSLGGIFSAQVVEHLPVSRLRSFFALAHRALVEGGILIAETLNPESVFALTRYYFLDPTHTAPLPPSLLSFMAQAAGFGKAEIKYVFRMPDEQALQPVDTDLPLPTALIQALEQINSNTRRLNDLLYGHLEYALVARK